MENTEQTKKQQFVALPKKEDGDHLQKYEILVYVSIRRYMNAQTMKAYPAYDRICKDSGLSKSTVIKTIKAIEAKGYMKHEFVPGHGITYIFNNEKSFEPFSYDFLDNEKLTKAEKLQILCTQQFMFKKDGIGKVSYSDRELAEKTGLDYRTIAKNNNTLIEKGYVMQIESKRDPLTGLMNRDTIYRLNEIGQAIVFTLQNHETRLNEHETELELCKKKIAELERRLAQQERREYTF